MRLLAPTIEPLSRPVSRVLALLFCGLLIVPGLVLLSGLEPPSRLVEKRSRQGVPDLRSSNPVKQLENVRAQRGYFNDRFGLRAPLIELNARMRVKVFRVQVTDKVVIGKDDWLFLKNGAEGNPATMPVRPFAPDELEAWQRLFETRRDALLRQGVRYLVVIAPNKASIYPEYLPDAFTGVRQGERFRQLKDWMARRSDVLLLDLHAILTAWKRVEQVYQPMGTHWSPHGALRVSRRLYEALGETDPLPRGDAYVIQMLDRPVDELANLLGMPWPGLPGKSVLVPAGGFSWRRVDCAWETRSHANPRHEPFATEMPGKTLRLVVYRDSFFTNVQPFVSELSARAAFVWSYVHEPIIVEAEKPDWVIDEIAERRLTLPPPDALIRP